MSFTSLLAVHDERLAPNTSLGVKVVHDSMRTDIPLFLIPKPTVGKPIYESKRSISIFTINNESSTYASDSAKCIERSASTEYTHKLMLVINIEKKIIILGDRYTTRYRFTKTRFFEPNFTVLLIDYRQILRSLYDGIDNGRRKLSGESKRLSAFQNHLR